MTANTMFPKGRSNVLFDHCAECQRCCHVDAGYPPLDITLTATEEKKLGSVCIETRCDHLGPQGCTMGSDKPFGCTLYPLSYNPNNKSFYFDTDCPLMDDYMRDLKNADSDASQHLAKMQHSINLLEKTDPQFLKRNHEVDITYFELKKIPALHSTSKQNKKKSLP
jgi:Fe-S-cluster containining protein